MENKKIIIGIVVVLILLVGGIFLLSNKSDTSTDTGSSELTVEELSGIPETGEEIIDDSFLDEDDDVEVGNLI